MSASILKSEKNENTLYQADIKAYENTWTNHRRKRRLEQRLADGKRQKTDDSLQNKSVNERVEHTETTSNSKALFSATLVLRKKDDSFWMDMLYLDGNKDNFYQVFQFLKNRYI